MQTIIATVKRVVLSTATAMLLAAAPVGAEYTYNRTLQLDGNGDYVEVNTPLTITTFLAVEAWIKTSVATGDQAIIARYNAFSGSNLDDQFLLSVHNGKARFQVNPGNTYVILDGNTFVADGRWHHVVGIYNSARQFSPLMQLYVDGSFDNGLSVNVASHTPLNNPYGIRLRIGALYNNGQPGFFFNGLIDEVRLWDREWLPHYYRHIPIRNSSGAYPLRAAWRFNGYPDTGFDAALVGNAVEVPVSDVPVHADFAIALNGRGYLNILQGSSLTPTTGLTIEAWVSSLSQGGTLQSVVSKFRHNSNSLTDDAYFLGIEPSGVARFQISIGSNWHMVQGTTNLLDGRWPSYRWHHLAGVFDGRQLRLYVDGQLEASGPLTGALPSNNTPLYIGASQEGPTGVVADFFYGFLDDVRLWNVALGEAAIRCDAGVSTRCLSSVYRPSSLVAQWQFEGDFINLSNYRSGFPRYWGVPAGTPEYIQFCSGACQELADDWTNPI